MVGVIRTTGPEIITTMISSKFKTVINVISGFPYHISYADHIPSGTPFQGDCSKRSITLRYLQKKDPGIGTEGGSNG